MIEPTVVPRRPPITPEIIVIVLSTSSTLNNLWAPLSPLRAPIATHVPSLAARPTTVAPRPAVRPNTDAIFPETFGKNFLHLPTFFITLSVEPAAALANDFDPVFLVTLEMIPSKASLIILITFVHKLSSVIALAAAASPLSFTILVVTSCAPSSDNDFAVFSPISLPILLTFIPCSYALWNMVISGALGSRNTIVVDEDATLSVDLTPTSLAISAASSTSSTPSSAISETSVFFLNLFHAFFNLFLPLAINLFEPALTSPWPARDAPILALPFARSFNLAPVWWSMLPFSSYILVPLITLSYILSSEVLPSPNQFWPHSYSSITRSFHSSYVSEIVWPTYANLSLIGAMISPNAFLIGSMTFSTMTLGSNFFQKPFMNETSKGAASAKAPVIRPLLPNIELHIELCFFWSSFISSRFERIASSRASSESSSFWASTNAWRDSPVNPVTSDRASSAFSFSFSAFSFFSFLLNTSIKALAPYFILELIDLILSLADDVLSDVLSTKASDSVWLFLPCLSSRASICDFSLLSDTSVSIEAFVTSSVISSIPDILNKPSADFLPDIKRFNTFLILRSSRSTLSAILNFLLSVESINESSSSMLWVKLSFSSSILSVPISNLGSLLLGIIVSPPSRLTTSGPLRPTNLPNLDPFLYITSGPPSPTIAGPALALFVPFSCLSICSSSSTDDFLFFKKFNPPFISFFASFKLLNNPLKNPSVV